jgi:antitoxin (DNA-binding transcriptional repressor) of toxin-antitoxin stability system
MTRISVEQAQSKLGDLVDAAAKGEEVVLVHGSRSARLVVVDRPRKRPRFGSAKGLIVIADDVDAPLEDFREYMEPGE